MPTNKHNHPVSATFAPGLFTDRTVLITGGAGTINRGIGHGFASLGASVALLGRTPATLEDAARELRTHGRPVLPLVGDVEKIDTLEAAFQRCESELGPIDVLILGAAANFPAPAEQMSASGFSKVIDVDLKGSFNAARAAFRQLKKTRGTVIFVSATNSLMPFAFQCHVGAAKAGMDSLMRGLALEWGPHGIRCNSVLPGPIEDTEGLGRLLTSEDVETLRAYVPIGRFGTVGDVAAVAVFLASPAASLLTGVALIADGGQAFSGSAMVAEVMANP